MPPDKQAQDNFDQIFSRQLQLSLSAIEQQVGRFQLLLAGEGETCGLPQAQTILFPRERAMLPEPRGEWERKALARPSLLKRDYLKAQLYDIVEAYGGALRMREGPKAARKALDAQIDLFIRETQTLLSERLRQGLYRGEAISALAKSLCQGFEKRARQLNGHVRRRYRQAGWYHLLSGADLEESAPFQIIMEEGPGSCDACRGRAGRRYTLQELEEEDALPPFHPNCRCFVLPVYPNHPAVAVQAEPEQPPDEDGAGQDWYAPLLRIPDDAWQLLCGFCRAQEERLCSNGFFGILDWLSLGIVSGFQKGLQERTEEMFEEPNLYTIGNWLTLGLVEQGKEALFPEEPLSLSHWLSAIGFSSVACEIYVIASGQSAINRLLESGPEIRPTWKQSELDIGREHPSYQPQQIFLNGEKVSRKLRGCVQPDFYKKGWSIEIKNYRLKSAANRRNMVRTIIRQFKQRQKHLPKGTRQLVRVDIRGQRVPLKVRLELVREVWEKSDHQVIIRFKKKKLGEIIAERLASR